MNKLEVNFKDNTKCIHITTRSDPAFWCKTCHRGHQSLWKLSGNSYCDNCLSKELLEGKEIIEIDLKERFNQTCKEDRRK